MSWWTDNTFNTRRDWNSVRIEGRDIIVTVFSRIRSDRESYYSKDDPTTISINFDWRNPPVPERYNLTTRYRRTHQLVSQDIRKGDLSRKQLQCWVRGIIEELEADCTLPKAREIAERIKMEEIL